MKDQATQNAETTYLNQVAAESQILDTKQQGAQASGSMDARAAASGIKGGGTAQDVLASQVKQATGNQQRAATASMSMGMANVEKEISAANKVSANFQQGSAYMNLYNQKVNSVNAGADLNSSQLQTTIDNNKYNWASFATDALSVVQGAASLYTQGAGAGWWGSGGVSAANTAFSASPGGPANRYTYAAGRNQNAAGWRSQ